MSIARITRALVVPMCSVAAVALLLSGCGDDSEEPAATTSSTSTTSASSSTEPTVEGAETVAVEVYFVRDEHVAVDGAQVALPATARGAIEALLAGPDEEAVEATMSTEIPVGTRLLDVSIDGGQAVVDLSGEFVSGGGSLSMQLRAAQVVFTLTQFDTVDTVTFRIDGAEVEGLGGEGVAASDVDRGDFESVTPLVLITSPLPGESVSSPIAVSGISNTFEATVLYEVTAADGTVLADGFTTATAGTGTWGEFAVEVDVEGEGPVTVVAYQENMEHGGRQDVYEVAVDVTG